MGTTTFNSLMIITTPQEMAHFNSIIEYDDRREFFLEDRRVAIIFKDYSERIDYVKEELIGTENFYD